jgi:hypothetical protein
MSKRKENESFYDHKKQLIFWKIFFIFLQTPIFSISEVVNFSSYGLSKDGNFYGFNILKINENASLKDVLQHYVESEEVRGISFSFFLFLFLSDFLVSYD